MLPARLEEFFRPSSCNVYLPVPPLRTTPKYRYSEAGAVVSPLGRVTGLADSDVPANFTTADLVGLEAREAVCLAEMDTSHCNSQVFTPSNARSSAYTRPGSVHISGSPCCVQ